MCPFTHASFLALGSAVAASFIFGFLWYGPLFGKTWAGLMGIKMTGECKKPEAWRLLVTVFGTSLTTLGLAFLLHRGMPHHSSYKIAALAWLSFYVPLMLGSVTWENRPWALFGFNALYSFLNLQLITAILMWGRCPVCAV